MGSFVICKFAGLISLKAVFNYISGHSYINMYTNFTILLQLVVLVKRACLGSSRGVVGVSQQQPLVDKAVLRLIIHQTNVKLEGRRKGRYVGGRERGREGKREGEGRRVEGREGGRKGGR